MLIDVHVHSHHSPGCNLAPRDIVRRAKEAGLDGVVVTDLNTLEGLAEVRAAGREEGLVALCGAELVTDHGHYLCYFPEPDRVPAPPQMFGATPWPVHEVLQRVRSMGGAVVAAHPYDKGVERPSGDFIFTLDGLAALQGLCARKRGPANDLAIEAADHMTLPCVGGSGAHEALDDIGKAATLFRVPVASEADLVRQLLAGHVFCVSIGGAPPARSERGGRERERHGARRGGDHGRDRGGRDRR